MPTTHPRYMLTDTGKVAQALDAAAQRWPDRPRRELVDLLMSVAAQRIEREQRVARQTQALRRLPELVDADVLLSDQAWR
jgi:hypothetical protein